MEPVQWSEKFSVGVRELDQQQSTIDQIAEYILISTQGTTNTHSETVSDTLMAMSRYAQVHFKAEESLMEAHGYPGLEDSKIQHRDFSQKIPSTSHSHNLWD